MVGDYIVWVLLIQFPFLQIVAILASQVAQRAGGLKHHIHRAAERVVYFHEYGIVEIMGYANIAFFSRLSALTMDKKKEEGKNDERIYKNYGRQYRKI